MRDKTIAVIPARGDSKRLPRKNVMDFMGQPMIGHTISAALDSGLFSRVLVSTDDPDIADIARSLGAEVPFLRAVHADDHSPVSQATIVAVRQAMQHFAEGYPVVVQLMANCPLRRSTDIAAAMAAFVDRGLDFLISAFRFGWMNPWWAATIDAAGHPQPVLPVADNTRSQDLPALFCPSGAIWIARWPALEATGSFFGPGHIYFPIDWMAAVDIDDVDDLALAKAVWQLRESGTNSN